MKLLFTIALIAAFSGCVNHPTGPPPIATEKELTCEDGPSDVFESRIAPILDQDRPQSCGNCHLAGVKLTQFIRGGACQSMACLVERELVDLESPRESKVLKFMKLGHQNAESDLITPEVLEAEYNGFLAWIEYSASCNGDVCEAFDEPCGEPVVEPTGPIPACDEGECLPITFENYGCAEEDLSSAWFDHVNAQDNRCDHCHAPEGVTSGIAGATLWWDDEKTPAGARRTIENLVEIDGFDFAKPAESRVLTKPLRPEQGGIYHGGSSKFSSRNDTLYVAMFDWILLQKRCLQ